MDRKPSLLYASPFPPQKSGISDYSVVLVDALKKKFDITLYSEDIDISDKSLRDFPIVRHNVDIIDFDSYDYKIYNMGNNIQFHRYIYEAALNHPGMVILHDYVIYHFFEGFCLNRFYSSVYCRIGLEEYLKMKAAIKKRGAQIRTDLGFASEFPMNKELLASGNKIMVHSVYARTKITESGWIDSNLVRNINLIEQIGDNEGTVDKDRLFAKYDIPSDAVIVASFGYVDKAKRNKEICEAINNLSSHYDKKICYVMVGQGDYVDDYLKDGLIIKTGFTELDEFNSFIRYSDIIMNLRFPSMGETSAAMLRILQIGKPCITNNGGWFTEIPDDVVCKIEIDNLVENIETKLLELIENEDMRNELGNRAKAYIEAEYNPDTISQQIYDFITK